MAKKALPIFIRDRETGSLGESTLNKVQPPAVGDETMPPPLRVLLVDDHPLVRAGIRGELEKFPWVKVVGEAGDGQEALELVSALHPDVVFMDISMPRLNGLDALERIRKKFPEIHVIILSMHDHDEYIWRALRTGAAGYVLKKAATAELGAALQKAVQG